MAVTVRRYQTPENWTFLNLKPILVQAFVDAGLASPNQERGGVYSFNLLQTGAGIPAEPNKSYRVTTVDLYHANPGAVISDFNYTRNGAGDINARSWDVYCRNFETFGPFSATFTSNGTTTVDVDLNGHDLSVGQQFFVFTTGAAVPQGFYTVASVVDNARFTFTAPTPITTGTATYTIWIGLIGAATRNAGNVCTVTMPDHPYQVGDRAFAHQFSSNPGGWWNGGQLYTVTAVTPTTFSFTMGGGGAQSVACALFGPVFRVRGADLGGSTGGAQDEWIGIQISLGRLKPGVPVHDRWPVSTDYSLLFTLNSDPAARHGQVFIDIGLNTNNRWIRFYHTSQGYPYANWSSASSGVFSTPQWEGPQTTEVTFTNYTDPLIITTYQSDVDPQFVVFRFSQLNQSWTRCYIPPTYKISPSAPFTQDEKCSKGSITIWNESTHTVRLRHAGGWSSNAWAAYDDSTTRDSTPFRPVDGLYYDSGTYGPVIVGLPLISPTFPPFYVYPPDFGWLVYRNTLLANDILEVSQFEAYEVISAASNGAFVARVV